MDVKEIVGWALPHSQDASAQLLIKSYTDYKMSVTGFLFHHLLHQGQVFHLRYKQPWPDSYTQWPTLFLVLLHHNVVNQKYTVLQANASIGLDSTILNPLIQFSSSYPQILTQSSQKGTHSSFIHLVLSILSISGSPFEFDQESSYELSFPAYMSHQAPKTLQLSHGILILIRMS